MHNVSLRTFVECTHAIKTCSYKYCQNKLDRLSIMIYELNKLENLDIETVNFARH